MLVGGDGMELCLDKSLNIKRVEIEGLESLQVNVRMKLRT